MDLESVQFLNLSPIPELSEVELSAMLEQLSNLSDLNCELSDRNVEDLLKEAEILIDETNNNKINDSQILNDTVTLPKIDDFLNKPIEENIDQELNQENDNLPVFKETLTHEYNKHSNTPELKKSSDTESEFLQNPFTEKFSKLALPTDSTINHIKSTIDSLREYSNMFEKQKSQCKNSPKSKVINEINTEIPSVPNIDEKEPDAKNDLSDESKASTKLPSNSPKKNNTLKQSEKKTTKELYEPHSLAKSKKVLNCFERLYQGKPVKFPLNHKKTKLFNKEQKISKKSSTAKNLKNPTTLYSDQKKVLNKVLDSTKGIPKKTYIHSEKKKIDSLNGFNSLSLIYSSDEMELDDWYKEEFNSSFHFGEKKKEMLFSNFEGEIQNNHNSFGAVTGLKNKNYETQKQDFPFNFCSDFIHQKNQEKLIFHMLQEMEEIKDQLKKVEIKNDQASKKKTDGEVFSTPKSDAACSTDPPVTYDVNKNEGIKKLQQQFSILKNKYDKQMEKLEKENLDLKKALIIGPKILSPEINNYDIPSSSTVQAQSKNTEIPDISNLSIAYDEKIIPQHYSPENIKVPKNSPNTSVSSFKDLQQFSLIKHACSQTERECQSKSIQCTTNDDDLNVQNNKFVESRETSKKEANSGAQKTENKENLLQKKKISKSKLFSDVNNGYQAKHKKVFSEHETQLMVMVKGLQAEALSKDKENRKLKTEIDLLKAQMKRLGRSKSENAKKIQIGTQTIALGPISQQPYNPEVYEVPGELEMENENLKLKIKTLESNIERLEEKRVHDLRSLHKVHEEEVAKLLSKLETQSALAKHLHSLLVSR